VESNSTQQRPSWEGEQLVQTAILAFSFTINFVTLIKIFSWLDSPSGPRHPHSWGYKVTFTHPTFGRTPLDEWSARRRHLYLTTYTTIPRDTHIHAPGRIRSRNPSKLAWAYPLLRPRGHWDGQSPQTWWIIFRFIPLIHKSRSGIINDKTRIFFTNVITRL
jgi:hypothetical protein